VENEIVLTEEDEGKNVVAADGNPVGRVLRVEDGMAYVDADQGPTDGVRSKLGWGDTDEDNYQLDGSSVESVSDEEIRLNK